MKLLTKENASKMRCFTLGEDGKVWARLLTATETSKIRTEARAESKGVDDLAENIFRVKYLEKSVTNWDGFYDLDGNSIPYSEQVIVDLFEVNPGMLTALFSHVSSEFMHIAKAEEKNSEAGVTA